MSTEKGFLTEGAAESVQALIFHDGLVDGQADEVQHALLGRLGAHMRSHLRPVLRVLLHCLQQQQQLLFRPLALLQLLVSVCFRTPRARGHFLLVSPGRALPAHHQRKIASPEPTAELPGAEAACTQVAVVL